MNITAEKVAKADRMANIITIFAVVLTVSLMAFGYLGEDLLYIWVFSE
jgi:hypothetical protein